MQLVVYSDVPGTDSIRRLAEATAVPLPD